MVDVLGYEGLYKVTEDGKIWSCKRNKFNSPALANGYYKLDLYKDGSCKKVYVHRLVAEAFLENNENKEQVNHKNGIKTDNRAENLEWVTRSENAIHAIRELKSHMQEDTPIAQIDKSSGKIIKVFGGYRSLKDSGFDAGNISRCLKNPSATHKGFRWKKMQI